MAGPEVFKDGKGGLPMNVRFGVGLPQGARRDLSDIGDPVEQFDALVRVALRAEELSFESVWLLDHLHTVPESTKETTFEVFTTLGGLARETRSIRLGQLAICNGLRNPALVAKMGSTIDVMSGGRLILGLGAGWYESEYTAYGYRFPSTRERMLRFAEAAQIIHMMLTEEQPTFNGKFYQIDGPLNVPRGVQQPHFPLWLAGGGERVTLDLVARFGDGCNFANTPSPETVRHKLDILRQHCTAHRRNFESLDRSVSVVVYITDKTLQGSLDVARDWQSKSNEETARRAKIWTAEQLREYVGLLIDEGINYFVFYLPRLAYDLEQIDLAADVISSIGD